MTEEKRVLQVDQRLSHLSEEELRKVMWLYFNNNVSVKDIVKRYRINVVPGSLYKILPPIQSKRICEHCGEPLYRKVEPRSHYKNKYNRYDYFCLNCGHEVFEKSSHKRCYCKDCKVKPDTEDSQKKELIKKHYAKEHRQYTFGHLNFEDQVALLYLLKKNKNIRDGIVIPFKETQTWTKRLDRFIDKGYLSVSPDSNISGFKDCDEFPKFYYTYKVKYDVNIDISEKEWLELKNHSYFKQSVSRTEIAKVFKEYIYEDLLQVFDMMMRERCISIEMPEKTKKEFKELVDKITYGEVLFFFEKVRKYCLEKIEKGAMTEKQAGKYALTNVVKFYEGNTKNNWKIYKRNVQKVGEELMFFIENVFDGDLKVLELIPTVGYYNENEEVETEACRPNEVKFGQFYSCENHEDEKCSYVRSGEMAEKFAKKLCKIWILCLPRRRFGELMMKFLDSLDNPSYIEDDELLEKFRIFCGKAAALEKD